MGFKKPIYAHSKKVDKLEKRFHELKRENETFSEINEKDNSLFESNIHCIYVHDFEGRLINANDAALSLMGLPMPYLIKRLISLGRMLNLGRKPTQ